MGNEKSNLGSIEIKSDVVEVTNSWTLKQASCSTSSAQYSVFSSPVDSSSSLELASKNLKIYRHPGIVKFIQTWTQSGSFNLATEQVFPLSQVLGSQTNLQVCLGLRSILRSLIFLHDTAKVSHTNVCCASIYVSCDNTWKLGNFEFLAKYADCTSENLRSTRSRRYEYAIPPEETAGVHVDPAALDTYAFGVMVQEILKKRDLLNDPSGKEFFELASSQLQNKQPKSRGHLRDLIEHPYFSHPVVGILEFLSAITLKTTSEKEQFFRGLWAQLATLPETMVATQLADLLLSRLVLLESSAQTHLVPWLLAIKEDQYNSCAIQSGECVPLFSQTTFERHLSPKLVNIFCVRDSQVRTVLLKHFCHYRHGFSVDQLQHHILPELLVGIKDNDDILVASTLRALADLVPVLGAATVIGGKRGKLFTDGRPKLRPTRKSMPVAVVAPSLPKSEAKTMPKDEEHVQCETDYVEESDAIVPVSLPERLSPDGGEAWSDWDDQQDEDEEVQQLDDDATPSKYQTSPAPKQPAPSLVSKLPPNIVIKKVVDDLDALDIKAAKISVVASEKEVDFFQDMEPVIAKSKPSILDEQDSTGTALAKATNDKFSVAVTEDVGEGAGWGEADDFEDWDEQDLEISKR